MYSEAGAKIVDANSVYDQSDIILKIRPPENVSKLKENQTLVRINNPTIGFIHLPSTK